MLMRDREELLEVKPFSMSKKALPFVIKIDEGLGRKERQEKKVKVLDVWVNNIELIIQGVAQEARSAMVLGIVNKAWVATCIGVEVDG